MAEELIRSREGARRESAVRFGCRGKKQQQVGDARLLQAQERRQTEEIRQMEIQRRDGGDCMHLRHKETQMGSDTCFRGSHLDSSHLAAHEATPASELCS